MGLTIRIYSENTLIDQELFQRLFIGLGPNLRYSIKSGRPRYLHSRIRHRTPDGMAAEPISTRESTTAYIGYYATCLLWFLYYFEYPEYVRKSHYRKASIQEQMRHHSESNMRSKIEKTIAILRDLTLSRERLSEDLAHLAIRSHPISLDIQLDCPYRINTILFKKSLDSRLLLTSRLSSVLPL